MGTIRGAALRGLSALCQPPRLLRQDASRRGWRRAADACPLREDSADSPRPQAQSRRPGKRERLEEPMPLNVIVKRPSADKQLDDCGGPTGRTRRGSIPPLHEPPDRTPRLPERGTGRSHSVLGVGHCLHTPWATLVVPRRSWQQGLRRRFPHLPGTSSVDPQCQAPRWPPTVHTLTSARGESRAPAPRSAAGASHQMDHGPTRPAPWTSVRDDKYCSHMRAQGQDAIGLARERKARPGMPATA